MIATAIFFLYEAQQQNSSSFKIIGAALLGFALLSKLTAFYLPALAIVTLALFELYGAVRRRIQMSNGNTLGELPSTSRNAFGLGTASDFRILALCAILAVAPYALFFARNYEQLVRYIKFGLHDIWDDEFNYLERASYYSPFSADGAVLWGNLHVYFIVFAGACLVMSVLRRDYLYPLLLLTLFLLVAAFWAPLAFAKSSNIEYAGTLLGIVIGATLISMCTFARAFPPWGGAAVLVLSIGLAFRTHLPLSFNPPSLGSAPPVDKMSRSQLQDLNSIYSRIIGIIAERTLSAEPYVIVLYEHTAALNPNLSIKYFQRTGTFLTFKPVWDLSNNPIDNPIVSLDKALSEAEFALTMVPLGNRQSGTIKGLNPVFSISADPARADKCVSSQDRIRAH